MCRGNTTACGHDYRIKASVTAEETEFVTTWTMAGFVCRATPAAKRLIQGSGWHNGPFMDMRGGRATVSRGMGCGGWRGVEVISCGGGGGGTRWVRLFPQRRATEQPAFGISFAEHSGAAVFKSKHFMAIILNPL